MRTRTYGRRVGVIGPASAARPIASILAMVLMLAAALPVRAQSVEGLPATYLFTESDPTEYVPMGRYTADATYLSLDPTCVFGSVTLSSPTSSVLNVRIYGHASDIFLVGGDYRATAWTLTGCDVTWLLFLRPAAVDLSDLGCRPATSSRTRHSGRPSWTIAMRSGLVRT